MITLDGTSGITAPALDSDGSLTIGTAVMAVPTGDAPLFGCRAWVNFDGTKDTTGAASTANTNRLIRGSGNVTSVLRNSVGNYTVTFTTAMPDANYSAVCAGSFADGTNDKNQEVVIARNSTPLTTSSCRLMSGDAASAQVDLAIITLAVFR
jgi:hypothetical protein